MKILVFNTKNYEPQVFKTIEHPHQLVFLSEELSMDTVHKVKGFEGVSCFVTDHLDREVIEQLANYRISIIALRSTGYDHVDLPASVKAGITVVHVPKYSPEAIAEFAVGLILILNRKILRSYLQGLNNNFLLDGLMGFNLYKKTVGIIGTGHIGTAFAKIMNGFGCRIIAVDPIPNETCLHLNAKYVSLDELLQESDIISLHCPLMDNTHHLIRKETLNKIKKGAMLINTGRGGLCNTVDLIDALESKQLGYAGLDVYEKEKLLFFKDHSKDVVSDELFLKLRALNNVLITPHQAFLTQEAVEGIIRITLDNLTAFEQGHPINRVN